MVRDQPLVVPAAVTVYVQAATAGVRPLPAGEGGTLYVQAAAAGVRPPSEGEGGGWGSEAGREPVRQLDLSGLDQYRCACACTGVLLGRVQLNVYIKQSRGV